MTPIRHVLFPTDHSPSSKSLKKLVIAFCERLGATLHTLHVVMPYSHGNQGSKTEAAEPTSTALPMENKSTGQITFLRQSSHNDILIRDLETRAFAAAPAICTFADSYPMDLIIMGTHGRTGLPLWLLGSVAESVVSEASCPVMTLRGDDDQINLEEIRNILVPVMLGQACERTLTQALNWAEVFNAKLHILHALHPPMVQALGIEAGRTAALEADLLQLIAELERTHGYSVSADIQVVSGQPSGEILEYVKRHQVDLILLGHRQSSGMLENLFQGVTQKVMRHTTCPIVATPLPQPEQIMARTH